MFQSSVHDGRSGDTITFCTVLVGGVFDVHFYHYVSRQPLRVTLPATLLYANCILFPCPGGKSPTKAIRITPGSLSTGPTAFLFPPSCMFAASLSLTPRKVGISLGSAVHTYSERGHLKHTSRGGQNLSDRVHRLERALRGKQALSNHISASQTTAQNVSNLAQGKPKTVFYGLVIPEEPRSPESDGTCRSSYMVVYDIEQ